MGVMQDRYRMIASGDPELPPEYRRKPYIESAGNAYIVLDYVPVQYDSTYCRFALTPIAGTDQTPFSAGTGTYAVILKTNRTNAWVRYFSTANHSKALSGSVTGNGWNVATINSDGSTTLNEVTTTASYDGAIDGTGDGTKMHLFIRANGGEKMTGKMSDFTISNGGTLKVKLIPCVRLMDNAAGMYDTVSGVFYASSGTESFTTT